MSLLNAVNIAPTEIKSAGVNIGYGNVKVKTDGGYFQYTSDVSRSSDRRFQDNFGAENDLTQHVTYNGVHYEVGEGACLLSAPRRRKTIFTFWAGTEPYMVLRQSVLDRLAAEGADWMITLGVPITELGDDEYTKKVQDLWLGEHDTPNGKIRIHKAFVVAEPSGALFYYGTNVVSLDVLRQQNLTIWDFGYFTTLGTTHHRLHADKHNTAQVEIGVSRVAEHITEALRKTYFDERDVVEVEMAMLGKWPLSIDNQLIDLAPFKANAVQEVGSDIVNKMRTLMPNPASRIYLVGGGAHLFSEMVMQAYPDKRVDVCDSPQQANAHGLWLLTRYQLQQLTKAQALKAAA